MSAVEAAKSLVSELLSYGMGVAFYGGVACIIVAVVAKVLGKEYAAKLFASGLAAIAVSLFGWLMFVGEEGLLAGVSVPADHGWVYLALAGGLLAVSGIYFALGRMEEGGKHFLFAVLVVGAMVFAVGLGGGGLASGGQLTVRVYMDKTTFTTDEDVVLRVEVIGAKMNTVNYYVDWGDGTRPGSPQCGEYECVCIRCSHTWEFRHRYRVEKEAAQAFTINVTATEYYGNKTGFNLVSVIVQNTKWCPYPWYLSFMCGLVQGVRVILPGLDLVKLVTSPEFPTNPDDSIYRIYQTVLGISMTALGLYLALGLAFGAFEGRIVEVFKDAVFALALALLIPWIYNASIGIMNYIALSDLPWIDPLLPAMSIIAIGVAAGYFVPALAQVASALILVLILLSAIVVMRYILILAIIAAFPLIAVASIHPLFRGIMRHCLTLLAGLVMAGPITAVFLKILAATAPGGGVTVAFLYPIVGGILPNLLSIFGAGVATSLGGAIVERVRGLVGRAAGSATIQQQARAGQTARIPTPSMSTARVTQTHRPAPIVGWSKLKTAWSEGKEAKASAELQRRTLSDAAELAPQMRSFWAMAEGADQKTIEQAYREGLKIQKEVESISPRAEQLKTFTRSLASQSWQQLKANAKAMARELGHALAREFGVKIRATSGSARSMRIAQRIEGSDRRLHGIKM